MLSGHLGNQTFLDGVAAYLQNHAYGNATTNDLWAALSKASGQNVTEFMVSSSELAFPDATGREDLSFVATGANIEPI